MKTSFRLVCIGVSVLCTIFCTDRSVGQTIGDGYFSNAAPVNGFTDIHVAWPGRTWAELSVADNGLGYDGSYVTIGSKQHLFQDFMDGRWLAEVQGSLTLDNGGFFGNFGVMRVFSLYSAGAEITTGFWVDVDDSAVGDYVHTMTALGVNASVETVNWVLTGNGYFPVGDSDYQQGDPANGDCFLNHSIVTQAGIDSALQGFDALFQVKPEGLRHVNGTVGLGGYGYGSDIVDFFGGVRAQLGMQTNNGMIINGEINHDNRFDVTGVLQVGWLFGTGAKGTEYGFLGTDLEPTRRNDHVVRFQQDLMLAIDPDTGLPYNVFHVDNLAAPGGDGSVERPFDNLAAAEGASGADDIIFVREGGGTTRNMDMGITLKPGQLLLGDGVRHLIPLADGTNFILCNDIDGLRPTITNVGFGDAVTLSSRNTVRGFIIDGSAGGLNNGIAANAGSTQTDGTIEDVTILGNPALNGIHLNDIAGNWTFQRNDVQTAAFDGIRIEDADLGLLTFRDNVVSNNLRDGIIVDDFDAVAVTFIDNATNNNDQRGIRIEDHRNTAGTGTEFTFLDTEIATEPATPGAHVATAQGNEVGISLFDVSGNFRFLNMEIRDNVFSGISMENVTTPGADQQVFVGTFAGGSSFFIGNGTGTGGGINNTLGVAGGVQQLLITDSTFSGGGTGIVSSSTAVGAFLETNIIDNISIDNNATDGIQLNASGGSTHNAVVRNTTNNLAIQNNGGNGISVNSTGPGPISLVDLEVENLQITGSGIAGIGANVVENGQATVQVTNTTIDTAIDGVRIFADNDLSSAVSQFLFDNVTIQNIVDDGVDIDVLDQTFVDFSLTNSNVNNGGGSGIEVNVDGDALAAIDTRFRIQVQNTTVDSFDVGNGIGINSTGDAHVLAYLNGNTITNNGANAANGNILPFGDGIDLTANGDSEIFARINDNAVNGNAEQGLDMNTTGSGAITAIVTGNNLSGNDLLDDGTTVPIESGNADMTVTNAVGGNVCLAMTNNFVGLPVVLTNLSGGPANFRFEENGQTIAPVFLPSIAAFDIGTFSTVCEPAIAAEEAVFGGIFPPLP